MLSRISCRLWLKQIQATGGAFAALLDDGSVITWGRSHLGGDSSAVQAQLKNVQHIQATHGFCCHSGRWIGSDLGYSPGA